MLPKNNLVKNLSGRFRRLRPAQKALLIGAAVFLSVFSYLLLALFGVSEAELRLASLRRSWRQEPVCREECLARRRQNREKIVAALEKDPASSLARRIRRYFLDETENQGFRAELIGIWREASDAPPDYMAEYSADPVLAGRVLSSFPSGEAESYLEIIRGDGDDRLKIAAVRALSSDIRISPTPEQVSDIGALAVQEDIAARLRQSLIMLLGDYYILYPDECSDSLRAAYSSRENDSISRAFAADLLNRYEPDGGPDGGRWPEPAVTAAEWDEYYNY